jgi:hypothetical protein
MKALLPIAILALLVLATGCSDDDSPTGPSSPVGFSDEFDDDTIDSEQWAYGGNVTETNGMLEIRRDSPEDFIETQRSYSGTWTVTVEIRLNAIQWQDSFHGISVEDEDGYGLSFGFSRYGKLYLATRNGPGTGYAYGPDGSNRQGEWQTWTLERAGGVVSILVDGQPVPGLGPLEVPNDVKFNFAGVYSDGDGPSKNSGPTSSDIQSFSVE